MATLYWDLISSWISAAVSKATEFSGVSSVISVIYALKLSNMIYLNFSPCLQSKGSVFWHSLLCRTKLLKWIFE